MYIFKTAYLFNELLALLVSYDHFQLNSQLTRKILVIHYSRDMHDTGVLHRFMYCFFITFMVSNVGNVSLKQRSCYCLWEFDYDSKQYRVKLVFLQQPKQFSQSIFTKRSIYRYICKVLVSTDTIYLQREVYIVTSARFQ